MTTAIEAPGRKRSAHADTDSPLPSPEQVFADWLRWVPPDTDVRAAARAGIVAIDRCRTVHPDAQFLRILLFAMVDGRTLGKTSTKN